MNANLWTGRYASYDADEYWAEAVKYWFGGDSPVNGSEPLSAYDAEIAGLIEEVFGETAAVPASCKP